MVKQVRVLLGAWPKALAALSRHPIITKDIAGALSRSAFDDARHMVRTVLQRPMSAEMVISRRYRFLWLLTAKVASRSIKAVLRDADPDAQWLDTPVRDICAAHPEVKDYYRVAFIRHPFHRTISWHREVFSAPRIYADQYHLYEGKNQVRYFDPVAGRAVSTGWTLADAASGRHKAEKSRYFFHRYYGLERAESFDGVCSWLNTPYGSDAFADRHFRSQHVQIRSGDGPPDFVGRFEHLEEDMHRIAVRLGMPVPALPLLNTMAGWQASPDTLKTARAEVMEACLTDRNKALLRKRYADDLELGGYSPD